MKEVKTAFALSDQSPAVSLGTTGEDYQKWVSANGQSNEVGQTKKIQKLSVSELVKLPNTDSSVNSRAVSNTSNTSGFSISNSTNNSNSNVDGNTGVRNVGSSSNNSNISNDHARNIINDDVSDKKTSSEVTPISNSSINSWSNVFSNNINVQNNCNFGFTSNTDIICNNVSDSTICNINVATDTNIISSNVTYTDYSNTLVTSLINSVSSFVNDNDISNGNTTENTNVICSCITSDRNSNTNGYNSSKNNDDGTYSNTITVSNNICNDCSIDVARGNDSNSKDISKNGICNESDANNTNSGENLLDEPSSTVDGRRLLSMIAGSPHGKVSKAVKKTRRGKRNRSSIISHCPLLKIRFNPYW